MRIEFAKSRARAARFTEEVELCNEEMARTIRFYQARSQEWERRAQMSPDQAEAHKAYAHRQSSIYDNLRSHCADLWKEVPAHIKRMQMIIENPALAEPGEFDRSTASKGKSSNTDILIT